MTRPVVASSVPMSNSPLRTTDAAVILAAGVGSRLRPLTLDRPKALVDVGGESILARAIRLLRAAGVDDLVVATGYREDAIQKELSRLSVRATLCPNPDYESTQNSVSLALCRDSLRGKSFFKLDGDVVFQPEVLERLALSDAELDVAVDSRRALDEEAMKVSAKGGQILCFGKGIAIRDAYAETIGIERLDASAGERVLTSITERVAAGIRDRYYEDFYSRLVEAGELRATAVEVGDLPWSEVDTFEDLERARGTLVARGTPGA
jgi:choline kinase